MGFFLITLLGIGVVYAFYYYGKPCSASLHWLIERDNPFCPAHKAETIVKNADIREGMRILDAGCGPGRVAIPAAKKVGAHGHVTALDLQEAMLSHAREKSQKAHLSNMTFLQGKLGDGQLGEGQFDRILLITVLGEIPEKEKALQELYKALKPSGILSITETCFDPDYQRQSQVRKLAEAEGFLSKNQFGNWLAYTINFEKP